MNTSVNVIDANGWTFTVRMAGPPDGRPVILLHGFPQTSQCFSSELIALGQAGYRAIAPDQRGYSPGARPTAAGEYRIANLCADVTALADAFDVQSFDLVGHDWGGLVAWTYTGHHPERVRTLTSVSTPHPMALAAALVGGDPDQAQRSSYLDLLRQPEVPEQLLLGADGSGDGLRTLFADSGIDDEVAGTYVETLAEPGALTAALNWYRVNDFLAPVDPGPIDAPTMYVWSTEDIALGRLAAESTAQYVRGPYRFEVLEGVSHWIPDAAPDLLSDLLLDHLGGVDST
jgi:pimeloyl-ACP methyl ester carboxylesterase